MIDMLISNLIRCKLWFYSWLWRSYLSICEHASSQYSRYRLTYFRFFIFIWIWSKRIFERYSLCQLTRLCIIACSARWTVNHQIFIHISNISVVFLVRLLWYSNLRLSNDNRAAAYQFGFVSADADSSANGSINSDFFFTDIWDRNYNLYHGFIFRVEHSIDCTFFDQHVNMWH